MSRVRLVALFTMALVNTSSPGPRWCAMRKAKIKFPTPEQYGIISVPSTVPSNPPALIASSRQIISSDAAIKIPRKHHGANAPVLSIRWINGFKNCMSASLLPLLFVGTFFVLDLSECFFDQ
jgi:hypothetical protein